MSDTLSHAASPAESAAPVLRLLIKILLAAWLATVFLLGAGGAFLPPRGAPPLALLIALIAPMAAFIGAWRFSRSFRDFVLACDVLFLTTLQAWRFAGLTFLALFTYGILPGYFALPAGLGDMAVGLTAPWILVALLRQARFAKSRTFAAWNVFGMLDLIVAVSLGALGPRFLPSAAAATVRTGVMTSLPLVLIPAYLVPLYIMLHLVALFQSARGKVAV